MAELFTLKQNDTRPKLQAGLLANAAPLDLTTASLVRFLMRKQGQAGAPSVTATAAIASAAGGVVLYTWAAADTATVGVFDAEFEVTFNDGGVETFPNDGYFTIVIGDDLSD